MTGTGWVFPIERAEVRITLPEQVPFRQTAIYTGPQGGNIDDTKVMNQVFATVDQVAADAYGATLIGQHTFGKNTVQIWAPLQGGAAGGVRITISRWFPPNHDSVHPNGVLPNVAVTIPAGTPPEKDLILDRALAFLATQTGSHGSPAASGSPTAALAPVAGLVSWDDRALHWAWF